MQEMDIANEPISLSLTKKDSSLYCLQITEFIILYGPQNQCYYLYAQ